MNQRLKRVRTFLDLKGKTNNYFIFPSVYKALRVNPWWQTPSGEQYLCSTKGNVLIEWFLQSAAVDPHQACRKPNTRTTSTLWDKQDTRESHSDSTENNVSSVFQSPAMLLISPRSSMFETVDQLSLCSEDYRLLSYYWLVHHWLTLTLETRGTLPVRYLLNMSCTDNCL